MSTLELVDEETRSDLGTYVARARAARPDGAVRLQAVGSTLAVWIGVLDGRGLMGEGATIGMRALHLAGPAEIDVTVPLAAVADRLARKDGGLTLDVPPQHVAPSWAALSPPRGGWSPVGRVSLQALEEAATAGIEEIAQGAPEGSGSSAVQTLRWRVWSRMLPASSGVEGLRCGVGFAVRTLGFGVGETAQVTAAGSWRRVTTPAGHVLVR